MNPFYLVALATDYSLGLFALTMVVFAWGFGVTSALYSILKELREMNRKDDSE